MSAGWATPWMGGDPEVGETFVQGKTAETARRLLAAADAVGVGRHTVRAVNQGFIVPDAVWDAAQHQADTDPESGI